MDDRCNRCGRAGGDLLALYRFAEGSASGLVTEQVCPGCCRRSETTLAARIPEDPELMAFVFELLASIDRLELSGIDQRRLVSSLQSADLQGSQ